MNRLGILLFLIFALFSAPGSSQDYEGTDFWVAFLNNINPTFNGLPFFEFSIEAFEDASITVEYGIPSDPYYEVQTIALQGNEVGVVEFGDSFYNQLNLNVAETRAFHITSTGDIRVHAFHNRAFFSEATAVIPTQSLGEEYRILTLQNTSSGAPSLYNVIATEDNTTVNLVNAANTAFGNSGDPFSLELDAGQVITISSAGDLSGSSIISDPGKPIAVFAGHQQALVGNNCSADSHAFEHMPPVEDWGTIHPIMPVEENGGDFTRVIALNDNTDILIDCEVVASLDAGEVWETIFETPLVLISTGPVLVSQFVSGLECSDLGTGDPNMRIVLPASQASLSLQLQIGNGFLQTISPGIELFFLHLVMPTSTTGNINVDGGPVTNWTEFPDYPGLSYAYWFVTDISVQALEVESSTPFWSQYVALGMADGMTMAIGSMATMEIPDIDPVVVDLGPDQSICPGQEIILDPGAGGEVLWQDGSTTPTFTVTEPGDYSVSISGACNGGFDEITISQADEAEFVLEPTFSICPGGETTIGITDPGNLDFLWSTGQSGPSITVTSVGIYSVTGSIDGLCASEANTEVIAADAPELIISGPTELCLGGDGILSASGDEGDIVWGNGEAGNTIEISSPGSYSATLTTAEGCEASQSYLVEAIPGPDVSIAGPNAICNGETAILVASGEPGIFTWGDGTEGSELEINIGGNYTVLLTNADGCFSEAEYQVGAISDPMIVKPTELSFCEGTPVTLSISSPNGTAFWPDFSESSTLEVTGPGIYMVAASNECGEVTETLEVVFIDCACPVYIPNAFSPNEDGLNDIFRPSIGCPVSDYSFEIFNRLGAKVFSTTDDVLGWNGSSEAEGGFYGDTDVYIYVVSFQNALQPLLEREVYRGHISIVR